MNNELQQHKTSDTVKWVLTLLAFVLVGVMLAGIICGWFDKKDKPAEETETTDGLIIAPNNPESNDIRLVSKRISAASYEEYGISPQADSAYTLTATIAPSNASNNAVNWTVSWVNPSSTWANGKTVTDYLTVNPSSDGALTANAVCKKSFGEQIKITVSSRENSAISAECICDYSRKITGFTFNAGADKMILINTLDSFTCNESFGVPNSSGLVNSSCKFTYSDYTVNDFSSTGIVITTTINPTFKSYLTAAGLTPKQDTKSYSGVWGGSSFFYCYISTPGGMQESSFCGFTPEQANQAVEIAKSHTDTAVYTLTISKTGTHSSYEYSVPIYFSTSSLTSVVTGVSLDSSSLMY